MSSVEKTQIGLKSGKNACSLHEDGSRFVVAAILNGHTGVFD